jgi:hypothetical protein
MERRGAEHEKSSISREGEDRRGAEYGKGSISF